MCYNSFMKNGLEDIIQNIQKSANKNIDFLKGHHSKAEYIDLPVPQGLYLYLILEGKIQFPDLKKFKQAEYFISAIDSHKTVKIIEKPF